MNSWAVAIYRITFAVSKDKEKIDTKDHACTQAIRNIFFDTNVFISLPYFFLAGDTDLLETAPLHRTNTATDTPIMTKTIIKISTAATTPPTTAPTLTIQNDE